MPRAGYIHPRIFFNKKIPKKHWFLGRFFIFKIFHLKNKKIYFHNFFCTCVQERLQAIPHHIRPYTHVWRVQNGRFWNIVFSLILMQNSKSENTKDEKSQNLAPRFSFKKKDDGLFVEEHYSDSGSPRSQNFGNDLKSMKSEPCWRWPWFLSWNQSFWTFFRALNVLKPLKTDSTLKLTQSMRCWHCLESSRE